MNPCKPPQTGAVGRAGEEVAAQFLRDHGYTVMERNYRSGKHEIDIIAHDREFLVFVEVKTRSCDTPEDLTYGRPARAVNGAKQHNITLAARSYLRRHADHGLQP